MAGSLYTPFATQAMGTISKGVRERDIGEAAKAAYMGDPAGLETLYQLDPQQAQQIEQYQDKQAQQALTNTRNEEKDAQAAEEQRRKFAMENKEIMDELTVNIGAFENYEEAKAYADSQMADLENVFGEGQVPLQELTPESFEAFKQLRSVVTGKDWERSGGPVLETINGKPAWVQKFVNPRTQETKSVPTSTARAITGHDAENAGRVAEEKRRGTLTADIDLADDLAISEMSAEAKKELIPARQRTQETLGIIEQLRNHPGRQWATGLGWLNPGKHVPGTDAHDFMVLAEQASGRVFAEAYETLKGGGQITEIESRKAEQAIARMETSQSQAEYLRALDEFEQATRDGYQKLLSTASTDPDSFKAWMAGELGADTLPSTTQGDGGTINNPAKPTTKAEYDLLGSGAYYIKNGEVKRKK